MPNAFDFHNEVVDEEVSKKAAAEAAKQAAIEATKASATAVIGVRPASKENPNHAKTGGGLFSAGGGASSAAGMSKKEAAEKVIADKKKRKFAKLFADEPEPPKLMALTAELMEFQRKNAAKKKRAARREAVLASLQNKGVDDGKGAQKLLASYVDEVLAVTHPHHAIELPTHVTEKKSWQACTFAEKLLRNELKEMPLVSQVVAQKALVPVHTQLKKKQFDDVCRRLKRNDGTLVRLRLNGAGVSDAVAHTLAGALEKNLYAQHLMLHDNRVTDAGVEELCSALRWHPSVHTVWLGGNPITDRGCIALANLAHVNHNIKDLNLSNKKPGQSWGGEPNIYATTITMIGCEALGRSLMRSCQLININLADQRVRDQGAQLLFSSLRRSVLRTLNLKNNGLTDKCCVSLRDVLIYESAADGYDHRNIHGGTAYKGPNSARGSENGYVAKGLHLEKLVLSENEIGDAGAANIAYALCYNKTLQALDLAYNKIDDAGILELLSCLQYNQVLRSMYTIYNTSTDERVDRVLELRAAAMRALEDHLDRVDLREEFHQTGLLVDRTGTVTSMSLLQKNRGGIGSKRRGGGTPGKDQNNPGDLGVTLSPSQLADSVTSRGGYGFDSFGNPSRRGNRSRSGSPDERDGGGREFDSDSDGDGEGGYEEGDADFLYGTRAGTADADVFRHDPSASNSRVGTSHSKGNQDIRVRPIPAFDPSTTDALKKIVKASKYAARDTQHLVRSASPTATANPSGRNAGEQSRGASQASQGTGYMLHDGDKYGDMFEDSMSDVEGDASLLEGGGISLDGLVPGGGDAGGSQSQVDAGSLAGSVEHTIGSNLSTGKTGKHLKTVRPNTSGSVIDAINTGRHSTDAATGVQLAIETLSANAGNPKVNISVRGAPQKPIDWSQIAMPAHLMSIARLASDHQNNKLQNFNLKERRELYKTLGNFIPRSARKPEVKSGGGRAGANAKAPSTAPAAGAGEAGNAAFSDTDTSAIATTAGASSSTSDGAVTVDAATGEGAAGPVLGSTSASNVRFGGVVDQFPANPDGNNPYDLSLPSSPMQSPPRSPARSPTRADSPPKSALRKASSFNSNAAVNPDSYNTGGENYSLDEINESMDGMRGGLSASRTERSKSPPKATRFSDEVTDYIAGTGDPARGRAGTPGGYGGVLQSPGNIIAAEDGGADLRLTKSVQEQHAEALIKANNATEAAQRAAKLAAAPGGQKGKKPVTEDTSFLPAVPIGRVGSAGALGMGGRPSPARPFRNFEEGNSITDIYFPPKRGGNTHESIYGSEYYVAREGMKRPSSMGVANFKSEAGNKMWNAMINSVGLSTGETRQQRDAEESKFSSSRYTHEDAARAQSAPVDIKRGAISYQNDAAEELTAQESSAGGSNSDVSVSAAAGAGFSPPRSPNSRAQTGGRSRLGTAPALGQVQEEEEDEDDPDAEGIVINRRGGGGGRGGLGGPPREKNDQKDDNEEVRSIDSLYDEESSQESIAGEVVPPGPANGYGGDMASFLDLFHSADSSSEESDSEDDDSDEEEARNASGTDMKAIANGGTDDKTAAAAAKQLRKEAKLKKKAEKQAKKEEKERRMPGSPTPADGDDKGSKMKKSSTESNIMTTEELEEIQQASITEKMRLGANLPNSTFKRLFDKAGKPILSKDLGKTMGVPKIPTTGIRPLRSATTQFRDSGQHIGYLRIATPDDPPMQRPISLMEIAKQQKEYKAKIAKERQTELYKELKKDAYDRIPRGKQRAAAYPIPDKFWEAWRRDNRLRYPKGIDHATGTTSTNIKDLAKLTKNQDGTIRMDDNARERLLVKTPGQALVFRRKEAKRQELERQKRGFYSTDSPTVGKAKLLMHDLLGLRADQSTTDLLNKKGMTRRTGTMEEIPLASMNRKPGAFKAPVL